MATIDSWCSWMVNERGLLPATVRLYTRTVRCLESDCGDPLELSPGEIRSWLYQKGGRPGTFSNRLTAARSYYRFLVRVGLRSDDPTLSIDSPRRHAGVPKPVKDIDDVLAKFDEVDEKANYWGDGTRRIGETRAIAVLLAETGLRISEACALDVEVPAPDVVTVIGKGHKEALIPLTDKAREALDFLGGRIPIKPRAVQRRFEKAGTHPHAFRHHLGCSLAESGADLGEIQDILRHASPVTTRTYAAYSLDRLRAAHARRVTT